MMQNRYMAVLQESAVLIKSGQMIYSPIVHFHAMACLYEMPRDIDFWWLISKDMIERADAFWVLQLDGWQESIGIMRETELAKALKLPIAYIQPSV